MPAQAAPTAALRGKTAPSPTATRSWGSGEWGSGASGQLTDESFIVYLPYSCRNVRDKCQPGRRRPVLRWAHGRSKDIVQSTLACVAASTHRTGRFRFYRADLRVLK